MAQDIVEQYLLMVSKKAWDCWKKLPPQTRVWLSVEDLIQDGLIFLRYYVAKHYDADKAKLSTFAWVSLENFYKTYLSRQFVRKRFEGQNMSLAVAAVADLRDTNLQTFRFDNECQSVDAWLRLYDLASPALRRYLEQWFLHLSERRVKRHGIRFQRAVKEFRVLAGLVGLTPGDCRNLLVQERWSTKLRNEHPYFVS